MDTFNNTPLHLAASRGHTGVVGLLLGRGASTEAMNKGNNTPVHLTTRKGHTDIVNLLNNKAPKSVLRNSA